MILPITLLIADDHALLRSGLRRLLSDQEDFRIVGEASTGQETIEKTMALEPDILLLDIGMPQNNVVQTIKMLRRRGQLVRILVLTMHEEYFHFERVLRAGASGYICKDSAYSELCSAIRMVNDGCIYIDKKLTSHKLRDVSDPKTTLHSPFSTITKKSLSKRETQVLRMVAQGYTNRSIAQHLGVSIKSVDTYRGRFMEKLELNDRTDIIRYALHNQII